MVGDMREDLWVGLGVWGARVENQSEQHATRDHLLRDVSHLIPRVRQAGIPLCRAGATAVNKNSRGQRSAQLGYHYARQFHSSDVLDRSRKFGTGRGALATAGTSA